MGAALAVPATGGDLGETMEEKLDSYMKAQVRSVAKAQGHNPDIAQGFVDDEFEVLIEIGEEDRENYPLGVLVLSKKGEVLSLSTAGDVHIRADRGSGLGPGSARSRSLRRHSQGRSLGRYRRGDRDRVTRFGLAGASRRRHDR